MARQSAEPPTDDGQSAKEIVVITGGNTGIGFEVARQLLCNYGNRFYVIIGSRTLGKGHTAVAALKQQGYEAVQAVQLDVTKEASIAAAAKIIGEQFGRIDVLHVNVRLQPFLRLKSYSGFLGWSSFGAHGHQCEARAI